MDQERFDKLARTISDSSSRRRVLGGALAGIFGAGAAKVAGVDAKGKGKGKQHGKGKGKGKNGKVKNQFVCTVDNANDPPPFGCGDDACCNTTPAGNGPACVPVFEQIGAGQFCGARGDGAVDAGEGVCRKCPAGTRCSNGVDAATGNTILKCVCTASTWGDGCCINGGDVGQTDDICVKNGSGQAVNTPLPGPFSGAFVCGTGGSQCNVCSVGTLFSGCCSATGACVAGTANSNCGSSGELCEVCKNDASCGADQACTGGTTTTTTTTTAAPGPCSDGRARCGPQQVCCASGFTCSGDSCAQNRKKRKKRKKHHHKH
jgi:hypothetical protein